MVPTGADETETRAVVLQQRKVKPYVEGKEIIRTVFVPDKLINMVVR